MCGIIWRMLATITRLSKLSKVSIWHSCLNQCTTSRDYVAVNCRLGGKLLYWLTTEYSKDKGSRLDLREDGGGKRLRGK